ncbi:MAG: carboxypeptidase regulatory-like domain-containing protein, partial [Planctomycetales bacterium]|nr:carboxypeptidase regulatory-like domain-containing protein [Planctomycetales bacterium]
MSDSNTFLDSEANNAFTVFGQVLDMSVPDAIAAIPVNKTNPSPYGELPLTDDNQLVVVQSVEGEGTLVGRKFFDTNLNGVLDGNEAGISGLRIYIDANANDQFDTGEISTLTASDGTYRLDVPAGTYALRAEVTDGQRATLPANGASRTVSVEIGRTLTDLNFGESPLTNPTSVVLVANFDTGSSNSDGLTRYNNSAADKTLQFTVAGVVSGATVQIFADGTLIGETTATGTTATVTTDGTTL